MMSFSLGELRGTDQIVRMRQLIFHTVYIYVYP